MTDESRAVRVHRAVAIATLIVPAIATAAAAVLWVWHGPPPGSVLAVTALVYALTTIGVTVGYHRLFTHRAFAAPAAVRWALAACGSASAQGPLLYWIAEHRRHHQFSDREGDPHSPVIGGFWHAHLGWMVHGGPPDLARHALDALRDRAVVRASIGYPVFVVAGFAVPAVIAGLWDGSPASAALAVVWGGVRIFMIHHITWSVNSVCHLWGTRPFATRDRSRNHAVVALLSCGEGWHNNHHAFPASARHGLHAWQLDISWWVIRALAALGLADRVHVPDRRAIRERSIP